MGRRHRTKRQSLVPSEPIDYFILHVVCIDDGHTVLPSSPEVDEIIDECGLAGVEMASSRVGL